MDEIKTVEYKGYTINIYQDDNAENPIKDWDVLGKYICWHKRYDLGNCEDFETPEDVRKYAKRTGSLLFPLYMYDHSGIALSLDNSRYPFNDRWDAGQLGYVLVDRQEALEQLGKKRMSDKLRRKITEIISGEVETYNQYLAGDTYGYVVKKDGREINSCWNFYEMDDVEREAKNTVDYIVLQSVKEHCQKVKTWIKNKVPFIYRSALILT